MPPRDSFSLFFVQEMLENCSMLEERVASFSMTRDSYANSTLYQDMLTMPMIWICEVAKLYRADLEKLAPGYDWKSVGAMRDKMAYPYGGFDYGFVWDAVEVDVPSLKAVCEEILNSDR